MYKKLFKIALAVPALVFSYSAISQDEFGITVGSATALPGQTVQVPVSACARPWCPY